MYFKNDKSVVFGFFGSFGVDIEVLEDDIEILEIMEEVIEFLLVGFCDKVSLKYNFDLECWVSENCFKV